ncbi:MULTISPECIES: glycosyltransferase family 61 protein [unclassified Nodularia (in: cyanobacteria)]|uniref:glycosyltransferase family 61 protein n=1 Tax=unclassified Nodularia (in: cyanobacteria) TaxID=2656917 RepID=UPI00187F73F6|nr:MULTISPECIES: glycosyltransferase family 61 protein [unclassified Nodularia (in: cyanobacteria)]MBE9199408.1 glycosyltransferase family 61 protein [Nodularia sp. LEGE 06071]MCC2692906.1 glycosyltransferase family 61 protein [Nodularia sp. LEGE 04288]
MNKNVINTFLRQLYYSAKPPICMDIATWAKERNLPVIETYAAVLSEVEPHIFGDEIAESHFKFHRDVLSRPQSLVAIENATVKDGVGLVQLPDGQICYEGNWYLPYLLEHPAYRRRFPRLRQMITGNVYSLLCLWGETFYHWFHDVLPRLEFALPHLPLNTKFLIQETPYAYQLDSLRAYGIGQDRLELQPNSVNTKIEQLWFASPMGHTGLGSGSALKSVAQRLATFFNIKVSEVGQKRIYISRQKAKARRVVNEKLLEPLLNEFGFQILICEQLSLAEQVQLFSNAEAIAGPHGAGLINMMYARCRIPIAEIAFSATVPCYFIMARQLGNCFSRLKAIPSGSSEVADMNLEPHELETWLKSHFST